MFTPVFTDVGGGNFTLGDITVCNADGVEFDNTTTGSGQINGLTKSLRIQLLNENAAKIGFQGAVAYVSTGYSTRDTKPDNWGWKKDRTKVIPTGVGFIVNNKCGAPIKFRVAGNVELLPQINIPENYSIFGNDTPVDITLGDITVCNADGVEFDNTTTGSGQINGLTKSLRVQLLNENAEKIGFQGAVAYVSTGYSTRDTKPDNWGWKKDRTKVIKSGQALIVNNKCGGPIIFKIKSPVEK